MNRVRFLFLNGVGQAVAFVSIWSDIRIWFQHEFWIVMPLYTLFEIYILREIYVLLRHLACQCRPASCTTKYYLETLYVSCKIYVLFLGCFAGLPVSWTVQANAYCVYYLSVLFHCLDTRPVAHAHGRAQITRNHPFISQEQHMSSTHEQHIWTYEAAYEHPVTHSWETHTYIAN
jgi:hypothetical protein